MMKEMYLKPWHIEYINFFENIAMFTNHRVGGEERRTLVLDLTDVIDCQNDNYSTMKPNLSIIAKLTLSISCLSVMLSVFICM